MKNFSKILLFVMPISTLFVGVEAQALESGVAGTGSTQNTVINGINWAPLNGGSIKVKPSAGFPAGNHYSCVVTCAATFENPISGNNDASYLLGISRRPDPGDPAIPNLGSQMVISFPEEIPDVIDQKWGPVTTTYIFNNLPEDTPQVFSCKARKYEGADPNTQVTNVKITSACSDNSWQLPFP